jgi:hypothetical protein
MSHKPAWPPSGIRWRGPIAWVGSALGAALLATILTPLIPTTALGHALGTSFPLPVPLWLYLLGAAIAVGASFVVAVIVGSPPSVPPRYPTRPVPDNLARVTGLVLRLLGLVWWYGAILAGVLIGGTTFFPAVLFWILIWVGVPIAAVLFGNPWPSLSPFRTTYDAADALVRLVAGGRRLDLGVRVPNVRRGPAAALLFVFLILELIWPDRLDPESLAAILMIYTLVTLAGMVTLGSVTWLRSFELFEILNGWFGRVGPAGRRTRRTELCDGCTDGCNPEQCVDCAECMAARDGGDQGIELRWWITGLTEVQPNLGWSDAGFIILALAGVTFDGMQETNLGANILSVLFPPLSTAFGPLWASYLAPTILLAGLYVFFIGAFALAVWLTRRIGSVAAGAPAHELGRLAGSYGPTLLPIAAGYLIAHYLTLVIQGVAWLPLLFADPNALAPVLDVIPTAFIWYLSVAAIVGGHIAAVFLTHRLALRDHPSRPILAGLPLVILMIGYTILSLWIIAQPIVLEPS